MAKVAVVKGSKSDTELVKPCLEVLKDMGIEYDSFTISAHRQPARIREFGHSAIDNGYELIIAAAGGAAHLPGVIASLTTLPVIGIPLPTSELKGIDALCSIVQMPAGIPVATVAVGTAGAKNAAYLAAEILGIKYTNIRDNYINYRRQIQGEGKDD